MKTRFGIKNWIIPLLGTGLVAGTFVTTTSYCNLEQKARDAEALSSSLGRLYEGQQMSLVLKNLHDGDAKEAARRLDLLLCNHIIRLDEEMATADTQTRGFAEDAFRRMALVKPKTSLARAGQGEPDAQTAAERILSRVLSSAQTVQAK